MMCKNGLVKTKLAMVDLDGTLVDTLEANYQAYKAALEEAGFYISYQTYAEKCDGKLYRDFLPLIMGMDVAKIEWVHERKKEIYKSSLKYAKINCHVKNILYAIKNQYYIALVTTASRKNANTILEYFGLHELFDVIVTQEDMIRNKPFPDCYDTTRKKFGIDEENTIIFEDSLVGIEAAVKSECNVLCYKGIKNKKLL